MHSFVVLIVEGSNSGSGVIQYTREHWILSLITGLKLCERREYETNFTSIACKMRVGYNGP